MSEYEPAFKVSMSYKTPEEENLQLENILWTVRLGGADFGTIEMTDLNGQGPFVYKVNHLHMHGPGEHRIDDRQYDLEIHIVHELVGGPEGWEDYYDKLAVTAIFFEVAPKSHPFIEKLRPEDFGEIGKISFAELFQDGDQSGGQEKKFYHYKGSLTNPPYSDVNNWLIYKEVLPISQEHLDSFLGSWYPIL